MEVLWLFNLYANGVSTIAETAVSRDRAHAVGVAVKHLIAGRATHVSRLFVRTLIRDSTLGESISSSTRHSDLCSHVDGRGGVDGVCGSNHLRS